MAWKRDSGEDDAVAAGVGDMTRACDRGGIDEATRRV
jgi:hypothetical protein